MFFNVVAARWRRETSCKLNQSNAGRTVRVVYVLAIVIFLVSDSFLALSIVVLSYDMVYPLAVLVVLFIVHTVRVDCRLPV
jgi:hypothetical protein